MTQHRFSLNFIIIILLSLFIINSTYSVFVKVDNNNVYYTSKSDTNIELSIDLAAEPLLVKNATITYNSSIIESKIFNERLEILDGGKFIFQISEDFSNSTLYSEPVLFNFNVFGDVSGKNVKLLGSPRSFEIKYDLILPEIISNFENQLLSTNSSYSNIFLSNEELLSYEIYLNNILLKNYVDVPGKDISSYTNQIIVDELNQFNDGENTLKIIFTDLAGNINTKNLILYYIDEELVINLLTKEDDESLKYFYSINYSDFFLGNIYTSQKNFELRINTNKNSECYLSNDFFNFRFFEDVDESSRSKLDSIDGLNHNLVINSDLGDLWLACISGNSSFSGEVVYLSESLELGRILIPIIYQNNSEIQIEVINPIEEIITKIFQINLNTIKESICFYSLNGSDKVELNTIDYLSHNSSYIGLENGNYLIEYSCFDRLYNQENVTIPVLINSSLDFEILDFKPKYASDPSPIVDIEMNINLDCKVSREANVTAQSFSSLESLSGTSFIKSFTANNLIDGDKTLYFIFCNKESELVSDTIEIFYDSKGPQISNFNFINSKIKSELLGSKKKIEFKFDINSVLNIVNYTIEFTASRSSENLVRNFSSNSARFKLNLSNYTSINVYATNEAGTIGNIIKRNLKFDLDDPVLFFKKSEGSVSIICSDISSLCNKIYYGFSLSPLDCRAKIKYFDSENASIKFGKNNFICAEAHDIVGNKVKSFTSLNSEQNQVIDKPGDNINLPNTNFTNNDPNNNNNDPNNNDPNNNDPNNNNDSVPKANDNPFGYNNNNNNGDEPIIPITPNNPGVDSTTYWIIAALILVLFGISGGGYYSYKKGYLDKQLLKMGLKPNSNNNDPRNDPNLNNQDKYYSSTISKNIPKRSQIQSRKKVKTSNYDKHIDKLNKFINEKISSDSNVYNKFKKLDESNMDKGKESLMKSNFKKTKISELEFDEFYKKPNDVNLDKKIKGRSLEQEAEQFENFYKSEKKKTEVKNKKSK